MSKWKATLPKELPPANKSNFLLAIKDTHGGRIELTGCASNETLVPILEKLMRESGHKPETGID